MLFFRASWKNGDEVYSLSAGVAEGSYTCKCFNTCGLYPMNHTVIKVMPLHPGAALTHAALVLSKLDQILIHLQAPAIKTLKNKPQHLSKTVLLLSKKNCTRDVLKKDLTCCILT